MSLKGRRARAHSEHLEEEWGCSELTRALVEQLGPAVLRGPFAGVRFANEVRHRHLAPKLIGSYECELHATFYQLLQLDYPQILDIGCAEGYYSIGLALKYPNRPVHAFDTDAWARRVNRKMANLNRVKNLTIHGACDHDWMNNNLQRGALVVCDCEGFEDILLDPNQVPMLRACHLVVELHDTPAPGVAERLSSRFSDTHKTTVIGVSARNSDDYPELRQYPREMRELAVSELRFQSNHQWLIALSRGGPHPAEAVGHTGH